MVKGLLTLIYFLTSFVAYKINDDFASVFFLVCGIVSFVCIIDEHFTNRGVYGKR